MENTNVTILGAKKKICEYCGRYAHPFTTRCDYNDLKSRVKNLLDKNAMIPELAKQNRDLTEIAVTFQTQFDNITKALILCEEVVKSEGVGGAELWKKFEVKLEEMWPKTSHQGTEESKKTLSQKNTIQSETESKQCIAATPTGETTAQDSLQ